MPKGVQFLVKLGEVALESHSNVHAEVIAYVQNLGIETEVFTAERLV